MPKYLQLPRGISVEEVEEMIKKANKLRDKCLIAMLWIYGMRPAEMIYIRKKDFQIKDDKLILKRQTIKHKTIRGIVGEQRKIVTNIIPLKTKFVDIILKYLEKLDDEDFLFNITPAGIKQIVYRLSACGACEKCKAGRKCFYAIPPYFFRHNRMNNFAKQGKGIKFLVDWAGWDDIRTALKYIRREPVEADEII